jgi:uncharacterized protein YndB with AHSA1/START domain
MSKTENPALSTWAMDREIVLSRVINAKREIVFAAWTDPDQIIQWFGPAGFTLETKDIDIRAGGQWRFVFIGPDGTHYTNRMVFRRIEVPSLLEVDHGEDIDNDEKTFRTTVTFDQQSNGKTVLTMRQLHPTKARRDGGIAFGGVEYGYQTLDKLARHVEAKAMG